MTEHEKAWTTECAARLRLVQADAAGLASEKRREFLGEEVSRKLKELPKQAHKQYLQALLTQFPVDGQVPETPAPAPVPAFVETKPPVATFEEVFDCFLRLGEDLPQAQRAAVVKKLAQAGWVAVPGEATAETMEKLRKELGIGADQQLVPARLAEMAVILAELTLKLEQAAFGALKQLSPRNPLLKAETLRRILAQFVLSDRPLPASATKAFEKLFGAILIALLEGGSEFARQYLSVMSPEMIWQVVSVEPIWKNKRELAWARYRELAEEYDSVDQINKKIREAMGASIDSSLNR